MNDLQDGLRRALGVTASEHVVDVEGAAIRYRVWDGPRQATPVVLVHGMLAHSRWWDVVAAWLSRDRPVVALDLSGMGDSDRRARYSRALHAREIAAVTSAAGFGQAVLVAHSFGGDPALRSAVSHGELFGQLVLLDCRLRLPGVPSAAEQAGKGPLRRRVYDSFDAARAKFRLMPESRQADPVMLDHVVRHSITACDGGWTWKFDESMATEPDPDDPLDVSALAVPLSFVRGDESIVTTPDIMAITRQFLPQARYLSIPVAGHHLMLDQPVALVALLRAILPDQVSQRLN